jgi:hypothetical protein
MPPRSSARKPDPSDRQLEALARAALDERRGRAERPSPPGAGALAARLAKPLLPDEGVTLAELQRRWADIVGERLAQLTAPEKLTKRKDGVTLTIRAVGSAAPFIQHQSGLIRERLRLAGADVADLAIIQGPLPKTPQGNVRPIVRPLSPEEEAALAAALASVLDPGLKSALTRLGRAAIAGDRA